MTKPLKLKSNLQIPSNLIKILGNKSDLYNKFVIINNFTTTRGGILNFKLKKRAKTFETTRDRKHRFYGKNLISL